MKIVDKGWAVWGDGKCFTPPFARKGTAMDRARAMFGDRWEESGFRVLRTTATATVEKKKARKK